MASFPALAPPALRLANSLLRRALKRLALLTACLIVLTASSASAETLLMPSRDMLSGLSQVLWGVTTLPNHTTATPTTYTINFGDGTANATGNVTDRSYIAVTHTFAAGGSYTVTLTITRAGTTETATTVVRVFEATAISDEQVRAVRINSAIEDGLRYLWVNQASRAANFPAGVTTNWGSSFPESFAALIVLAFENHGYRLPNSDDEPTGLYEKYIVRRGLNFVIDELRQVPLAAQAAGDPCVNVDDGPAPCVGLRQNQQSEGYATSLAILPLAASNALTRHVSEITGSQNSGYVVGKTYAEVLQRLVNALAWGQNETGTGRGGWEYTFNTSRTDGSTIGWNVLALLDAAAAGISVPAFVKTEFVTFAIPFGLNNDGTFDYTSGNNPAVAQGAAGANMAKNGIGVQAMFYADLIGLGEARVLAGRNAISTRWNAPVSGDTHPCGGNLHNKGCGYAMFNVFKALKLQGITTLPGVSRPAGPGAIPAGDWYADYVDWLLANQTAPTTTTGGHWAGLSFSCCGEGVVGSAALAELILSPVALIAPDPFLFSTIGLGPTTALHAPGGTHTVTATATSAGGAPVAGATVNFRVLTGPNTGATGQGVTNAAGQTTFTYTDTGGPGRDTIRAFIGTLGSNTVEALWQVPECSGAAVALAQPMYPLDQGWRPFSLTGVSGATVTQVCQDEPPNFENIAAWAVDANGVGTSAASVRAQRSGTRTAPGNGRVYTIFFTAQSCSGQVTVGVPTTANGTATNDGARYNSVTGADCVPPPIPTVVVAPTFVGKTPAVAAAEAAAAGVQLTIESLNSPTVPVGIIISQFPTAGASVAQGSSVVISVSTGPTSVAVPHVVGQPQATATSAITGAGLSPSATSVNDPAIAAGLVIAQAPAPGTQVPPGSGVSLTISLGPAVATVPNVVARNLSGAVTSITSAGLNLGTANSEYNDTVEIGLVISQTPAPGTIVSPGSFVNVLFSLGPTPVPVPVPALIGQTEAEAVASLTAAGLVVGDIARVYDPTVPSGYVIAQSPANTGSALPGSTVDLTVSLGPAPPPGSTPPPPPGANAPPSLAIESPISGALLETDVQVTGSVSDADLASWALEYRVPGTTTWTRIGTGTTAVASGVLGTFPVTLVANGPYRLRLTAFDTAQAISREIEVQVDSKDLKLGDFTLAYEDLQIPALTFPISITRTYDTKRLYAGDFGPGWSLSFTGVDLRQAANNDIYITLPTGRRVQFKHTPVRHFLFPIYTNRYTGAPGVADTLENTDCPYLFGSGGFYLCGFFPFEPQDFILKTTEGLTYTVHANGGISRIEDRAGNFVTISPTAITTSWQVTVPITRGPGNRITHIGEPAGPNGITYNYDAEGRLSEVHDQAGQPTTFLYEDARFPNYLTTIVDPMGRPAVRTIFDDAGRLIARCNAGANFVTLEGCARFNPDVAARIQTLIDGRGARTDLVLDSRGNVVTERRYLDDGTFQDTSREFDAAGRLLREFGPSGARQREYTYDANGNVLTAAGTDGRTTTFTYNAACNKVATQRDPLGQLSTFAYDASCNLIGATAPDGSVTTLTYTPQGQIATLHDGTGGTWTWEYDANGFPTSLTDALGKKTQATFTANGDLITRIDRNGRRIDFAYDAAHRPIRETWDTTPARTTTYEYFADGSIRRAFDPDSSIQFTYTSTGEIQTVDTSGTPGIPDLLLTYGYDKNGYVTNVTDSLGGSTTYSFDVLNRLSRIQQAGTSVNSKRVDFSYDAAGVLERVRRFANLAGTAEVAATTYEYQCPGCTDRVSAIRHQRGGATVHDITLQRNDIGDIREIVDADGRHVYGYDLARQLASVHHTPPAGAPLESYVYDAVGNRLSSHLLASSYSPTGNHLLQDDNYFYRYDDEGNLVEQESRGSGAITRFTYDFVNRLTGVSERNASGVETGRFSYVYDVSDRRIQSDENGVVRRYAYDGIHPFLKFDATGQIVSRRLYAEAADQILADDTAGGTRWFLTDHLGTVRDLLSNDGTVLAHYTYDAFGQPVGGTPPVENDLRFTGREFSDATGLLYLRARYYSPRLGRFISEDPTGFAGRDVNLYRYSLNSPTNRFDLSGETFFERAALQSRIQSFVTAAVECLGKAVFTTIGEAGVYLLFAGEGIPIFPGADSNVYAGKTTRTFAVRFREHAAAGKLIGETTSFRISEEFLKKNPKALATIEQLLMDAFGGKASLANKYNATRKLFCN